MRLITLLPLLTSLGFALAASPTEGDEGRLCGFKIAPCEPGTVCVADDPACPPLRGENCSGKCLAAPKPSTPAKPSTKTRKPSHTSTTLATKTTKAPRPTFQSCGGFRVEQVKCPKGFSCVDDPYVHGCGMACDRPGICVDLEAAQFCGGFAGFACKDGKMCIDDPRDDCDPLNGGADCGGVCI